MLEGIMAALAVLIKVLVRKLYFIFAPIFTLHHFPGVKYFTGGNIERLPHKWYNLCVLFKYGGPEGATR